MFFVIKSLIDRTLSLGLIVLLLPVFAILCIILFFSLKGSPIFTQVRPGYKSKLFVIRKLRTMSDKRDKNGFLLPDKDRITSIGGIVRSLSLDELPQLWNVLIGDMSFVGPRPLLPEYLPLYNKEQKRRHNVKPGITGWAQVNGRNAISWEEKFRLDVWYVDNQSFILDIRILFKTIEKVVLRKDISAVGNVTVENFKGNEK